MLFIIVDKIIINKSSIFLIINIVLYLCINIYCINCGLKFEEKNFITDKNSPYKNSFIEKELLEEINVISDFIKNNEKVIVFSEKAPLYMTNINKNNGVFDLPFVGNLGKEGVKGLIEKIKKLENTKILLNDDIYWQIPLEAKLYIIKNFKKTGQIEEFSIYE